MRIAAVMLLLVLGCAGQEQLKHEEWEKWERQCAAGDAKSCLAAGEDYARGEGTAADPQKAAERYAMACKPPEFTEGCRGVAEVAGRIGRTDPTLARRLLEPSCNAGAIGPCHELASIYSTLGDQDRSIAANWKACRGGEEATGSDFFDAQFSCSSLATALEMRAFLRGPKRDAVVAAKLALLAKMMELERQEDQWARVDESWRSAQVAIEQAEAELERRQAEQAAAREHSDDTLQIVQMVLGGLNQIANNVQTQQRVIDEIHAKNAARVAASSARPSAPRQHETLASWHPADATPTYACAGVHQACGKEQCCANQGLVCRGAACCEPAQSFCHEDSDCCDAPLAGCHGVKGLNMCCVPSGLNPGSSFCCNGVSPQTGVCL
jgi:hypothetical protein